MEVIFKILGFVALIVGLGLLYALPVMLLWNWLMPEIFGFIEINFWQALGLSILSGLLFTRSYSGSKD